MDVETQKTEHTRWTPRLFVENARLCLPEQAKSRAEMEADALRGLFSR